MMQKRNLGSAGIQVSPIGIGTTKFGRNQAVKFPEPFELPSNSKIINLLSVAKEEGINLIDTAPAYGSGGGSLGSVNPTTVRLDLRHKNRRRIY